MGLRIELERHLRLEFKIANAIFGTCSPLRLHVDQHLIIYFLGVVCGLAPAISCFSLVSPLSVRWFRVKRSRPLETSLILGRRNS